MHIDEIKHIKYLLNKEPSKSSLFLEQKNEVEGLWKIESSDRNIVLKSQIFVEHYCTEVLLSYFRNTEASEEIRNLKSSEKLKILKKIDSRTKEIASCIEKLNRIRNKFAHEFDYKISKSDINGLKGNETISQLLKVYNLKTDDKSPGDVIETIAQLCGIHLASTASANNSMNSFKDFYVHYKANQHENGFEGLLDEVLEPLK